MVLLICRDFLDVFNVLENILADPSEFDLLVGVRGLSRNCIREGIEAIARCQVGGGFRRFRNDALSIFLVLSKLPIEGGEPHLVLKSFCVEALRFCNLLLQLSTQSKVLQL